MECKYCGNVQGYDGEEQCCDCEERINCPKAGDVGHKFCGKLDCGCPKFIGCIHEDDENMPELQCIHGKYGLCEKCGE